MNKPYWILKFDEDLYIEHVSILRDQITITKIRDDADRYETREDAFAARKQLLEDFDWCVSVSRIGKRSDVKTAVRWGIWNKYWNQWAAVMPSTGYEDVVSAAEALSGLLYMQDYEIRPYDGES